ncbi:MAG: VOC family protein, partial [Solirubrobacteraceae bacterium]
MGDKIVSNFGLAAHVGHVELLVPRAEESLRFFTDVLGMSVVAHVGRSAYLRGWRDYERYTLKLTESPSAGVGHVAFRAPNDDALQLAAALLADAGAEGTWVDGDEGHGPAYAFRDPDEHRLEFYYETTPYIAPLEFASAFKNQAARSTARGAGVERLDHINLASA